MLRLFIVLGIAFNSYAWAAPAKSEPKVELTWIIDHTPQKYFETGAKVLSENLRAESKGSMDIKVNSIAAYPRTDKKKIRNQYVEMLLNNQTGIAQVYIDEFARDDKLFEVLDTPYLFRDHDHVSKVINGPIGKRILDRLEARGLKGLAFTYSGGYQNFLSGTKINFFAPQPFKGLTAGNFNPASVKALNLSSPTDEVIKNLFPLYPFHEIVEMNKADICLVTFADADEVFKDYRGKKTLYYYDTDFKVLFTIITMNKKLFDSLSPEQQKALQVSAAKAAEAERNAIIEDSKSTKEQVEAGTLSNPNITFVKMGEREMAALKKMAAKTLKGYNKEQLALFKEIQAIK